MDVFKLLFHLAAVTDPEFLGTDDRTALITMEANRLRWAYVPDPHGDKLAFATGYVMGREGLGRDPSLREGSDLDYDLGFEHGVRVRDGKPRPRWDHVDIRN
jgi:hypothetical protein